MEKNTDGPHFEYFSFRSRLLQTNWQTSSYTRSILLLKISLSLIAHITLLLCFPEPPSLRANGAAVSPCGPACSLLPSTAGDNVRIFIHCPP